MINRNSTVLFTIAQQKQLDISKNLLGCLKSKPVLDLIINGSTRKKQKDIESVIMMSFADYGSESF